MSHLRFFDKRLLSKFWNIFSIISGALSFILLFDFFPCFFNTYKVIIGYCAIGLLLIIYASIWCCYKFKKKVKLNIDKSDVIVKSGDIFNEDSLKVIPFNEYFDTKVDDKIIARTSLNGIYINKIWSGNVEELDEKIRNGIDEDFITHKEVVRPRGGKTTKYKIGTTLECDNEFVLTAFSKFDNKNKAVLTMVEYIGFLMRFWDKINSIYAQRSVSVPVFGSGITRISEHRSISDEDLLKIMLWTFKLSEYRFKYPAKLTIVVHKDKIRNINLLDLKTLEKGF